MMVMSYGYIYVAKVAMGHNRLQTIRAFMEAEAFDGPSLIIAYSHCIPGHGISASVGLDQQKAAISSGMWPLYRFNPESLDKGQNPLSLDSREPSTDVADYLYNEIRFKALKMSKPEVAEKMLADIRVHIKRQWETYKYMSDRVYS
jgi:pyruvate-ferredoxin/flavodoxin oxidoreductase